jgi:hypothetical protein
VRCAQPKDNDELLEGSGRLPTVPCYRRRVFVSKLGSHEKERAAASMFKARTPHRSSCSRHAEERGPSTEIRQGGGNPLRTDGPLLAFFVPRSREASGRDPPEARRRI